MPFLEPILSSMHNVDVHATCHFATYTAKKERMADDAVANAVKIVALQALGGYPSQGSAQNTKVCNL